MKKYISTDRVHEITGYSVDYIGQLCRSGRLACTLVDGEWAVDIDSVKSYSLSRGTSIQEPGDQHTFELSENPSDQSIVVGGKKYITTMRAAQLSSYAQDYIGQLVRNGKVDSIQLRGRWFVHLDSLLAYVREQEAAQVQSAVSRTGYVPPTPKDHSHRTVPVHHQSSIMYVPEHASLPYLKQKTLKIQRIMLSQH